MLAVRVTFGLLFLICLVLACVYKRWQSGRCIPVKRNMFHSSVRRRRRVPPAQRLRALDGLLRLLSEAGKASDTKPFLLYGTLLGFVRHRDFICYDYDVDAGVPLDEFERIGNALRSLVFRSL